MRHLARISDPQLNAFESCDDPESIESAKLQFQYGSKSFENECNCVSFVAHLSHICLYAGLFEEKPCIWFYQHFRKDIMAVELNNHVVRLIMIIILD